MVRTFDNFYFNRRAKIWVFIENQWNEHELPDGKIRLNQIDGRIEILKKASAPCTRWTSRSSSLHRLQSECQPNRWAPAGPVQPNSTDYPSNNTIMFNNPKLMSKSLFCTGCTCSGSCFTTFLIMSRWMLLVYFPWHPADTRLAHGPCSSMP